MSETRRKNCDRYRAEIREYDGSPSGFCMGHIYVQPPVWATKLCGMEKAQYSLDFCRPECLVAHFHELRGKWISEFNAQKDKLEKEVAAMNAWRAGQNLNPIEGA